MLSKQAATSNKKRYRKREPFKNNIKFLMNNVSGNNRKYEEGEVPYKKNDNDDDENVYRIYTFEKDRNPWRVDNADLITRRSSMTHKFKNHIILFACIETLLFIVSIVLIALWLWCYSLASVLVIIFIMIIPLIIRFVILWVTSINPIAVTKMYGVRGKYAAWFRIHALLCHDRRLGTWSAISIISSLLTMAYTILFIISLLISGLFKIIFYRDSIALKDKGRTCDKLYVVMAMFFIIYCIVYSIEGIASPIYLYRKGVRKNVDRYIY